MHPHLPFIAKSSEKVSSHLLFNFLKSQFLFYPLYPSLDINVGTFHSHLNLGCLRHSTALIAFTILHPSSSLPNSLAVISCLFTIKHWFSQGLVLFCFPTSMLAELNWNAQAHPVWTINHAVLLNSDLQSYSFYLLDIFILEHFHLTVSQIKRYLYHQANSYAPYTDWWHHQVAEFGKVSLFGVVTSIETKPWQF